jgi:hypothetical protein
MDNWAVNIQNAPLSTTQNGKSFFQFHHVNILRHQLVGWGHPSLMFHCINQRLNWFIDCTFSIVPAGFVQCLVLMAHLPTHNRYCPIFWVLLDSSSMMCIGLLSIIARLPWSGKCLD